MTSVLRRLVYPALAGLATAGVASAQETPAPPPVQLEPLVVTATRQPLPRLEVPAAISVLDAGDLRGGRAALSLAEALPRIPGVVVRERQNQAQDVQLSIRGFGTRASFGVRGVRLYADGIPATMPDGQGQVSHFLLPAAERIEVLRGPFSVLYGNSSGGVVSVFSQAPPAAAEAGAEGLVGSDGLWRASASWRGPVAGSAGLRLDAQRASADGYRRHSAWRRDGAQLQLRGETSRGGQWTLLGNHLDLAADDPQGLTGAQLAGDRRASSQGALLFDTRKTVSQQQLGARFAQPVGEGHELALVAYTGRRQTFQVLSIPVFVQARPGSGGGVIDLDRDYRGFDARWRWQATDTLSLVLGASQERADETRLGFENFIGSQLGVVGALRRDEDNAVRSDDVYLQMDWQPAERWRFNGGLRSSRVRFDSLDRYVRPGNPDDSGSRRYSRVSPVLGVLYRVGERASLYANAGRGFETPTFAELAYRSDGASGLNDLAPALSRHIELGLRWQQARWQGDVALFQATTTDELVVAASQGGRTVFDNAGLTRRRGAELSLALALAPAWSLAASATWLDARYRRDVPACDTPPCAGGLRIEAGRRLPGIATRTAWAELRWQAGERTDLWLEARASSRFYANDANTAAAPGHGLLGLGAEQRFGNGRWTAWARIDNLADRQVIGSVIVNEGNGRYFEPAPGRTFMLGLRLDSPLQ